MKRIGELTHRWIQNLARDVIAAFVRSRTKYVFLIIGLE